MVTISRRPQPAATKLYTDSDLFTARGDWRGRLRVSVTPYGRRQRIHIREWFPVEPEPTLAPGRGITFTPEHLDEVIEGLLQLKDDIARNRVAYVNDPAPPDLYPQYDDQA